MASGYDIVGLGVCAFDIIAEADRLPGPDAKMEARSIQAQGGGLVGTALVAASRLGGHCAYLGALGDDFFGDFSVSALEREGIDIGFVERVEGASAHLAVIVADRAAGTRMILWSSEDAPELGPEHVSEQALRRTEVLHVDDYYPRAALAAARLARSMGTTVTMDLEVGGEETEEFLSLGDYVIVPLEFAAERYGASSAEQGAEALFEEMAPFGAIAAVVTAGTRGSAARQAGGAIYQPAYHPPVVVDTTGCGDAYHGAMALGVARGWELQKAMQVAAATAALKCRALGGRRGIPDMDEVGAFLETARPIE